QLKALENQLGSRLLTRESGKRPQLTPEGAAFLADLGEFWRVAEQLASHRRAIGEAPPAGLKLRVLIGTYILKDHIRPRLDSFMEAHPDIHLEFVTATISDLPSDLAGREPYDIALYHEELGPPLPEGTRELARVRCGVFGHRSYLKGDNRLLTAAEVSELPFILPPAGTPYENLIFSRLAAVGVKPGTIAGRTEYFDVMSAMFERGNAVGVTLEPMLGEQHRNVTLLFPLDDWRLIFFRAPDRNEPEIQTVEDFLISALLGDPTYPLMLPNSAKGGMAAEKGRPD
ncbi:MAG TPA: LysR family transcriptional regulator, partial [Devosia sp.]|nr:LysR family transcriptional regulator [Devosia sp.]